jgi:excisionase family DNA binding protein
VAIAVTAPLLDADQVAELLNVPASWVRAQASEDRIPHIKLGRYVRFDPDELERWRQAQLRMPGRDR